MKNGPEYGDKTQGQLSQLLKTIDTPQREQSYAPSQQHPPYIRMDYDGSTLYVSSILESQEKAKLLIAAMTAMVPFLPKEEEPNGGEDEVSRRDRQRSTQAHGNG
jgi:hypothetical protein